MNLVRCFFLLVIPMLLCPSLLSAQFISGIINTYVPVTAVSCNSVTVTNPAGFSVNDKVLLIQMKGAAVDLSNTAAFGSVLNYNQAGNYEFAIIQAISGTTVTFTYSLLNAYDVSGSVQMISVPQYANITVNATLTAQSWNGLTGGVLVFEASGNVTLSADIDVSDKGFKGGALCANPDGGCAPANTDYFYASGSALGAEKGEGIVSLPATHQWGRGAMANGGGGGNKHNAGGGGGGNFTRGGLGGLQANFCGSVSIGGEGGHSLNYTAAKIFMGGGGGCSNNNDWVGTTGTNGGGIVIIRAPAIVASGQTIRANALHVPVIANSIGDGAGGGGAGGTILLDVNAFMGILSLEANGGNGGDQNTTYSACFGPGGGGGTGAVLLSGPALPVNVSLQTEAGLAGTDMNPVSPCFGSSTGAQPGVPAMALVTGAGIPQSNNVTDSLSLTVQYPPCSGQAIITADSTFDSYTWSTGDTVSQITVDAGGVYWVMAGSNASCIHYDTLNIVIEPVADIDIVASDDSLCTGEGVYLGPLLLSPVTISDYQWTYNGTVTNVVDIYDEPGATTVYYITVTDVNGCQDTDSLTVLVTEDPVAFFMLDTIACGSAAVMLETPLVAGYDYSWYTAGSILNGNPVPFVYNAHGIYDVTLVVHNLYCVDTFTINAAVHINPVSNAGFTAQAQESPVGTYQYSVTDAVHNDTYAWDFGDGEYGTGAQPVHTFNHSSGDFYNVCLVTNNSYNCPDTFCVEVDGLTVTTIYTPNAFTPNGDGVNDVFAAYGLNIKEFSMDIYDRWGGLVFSSGDIGTAWSGRAANGQFVQTGIYIVKLKYTNAFTTEVVELYRHVSVLR